MFIIACFVKNIKHNQKACSYSYCQSEDVDKGIDFTSGKVPKGDFDVVF